MTQVSYDPASYRLTIAGHAGSGARGRDLVCAGVSALGFALVRAARRYGAKIDADGRRALLDVRCAPADAADALRCRAVLDAVAGGLALLAERYPDYVNYKEVNAHCHGETADSMTATGS